LGPNLAPVDKDKGKLKDVNKDGIPDLELEFKIKDIGIVQTTTSLTLMGTTTNGDNVAGSDAITVESKKAKDPKPKKEKNPITIKDPKKAKDPPLISTRGNVNLSVGSTALNPPFAATDYSIEGKILGFNTGKCPDELIIYVHGFNNNEEEAIENFKDFQKSLDQAGRDTPLVGFTWDSDSAPIFSSAKTSAEINGNALGQFILDYKLKCKDTKIRLVSHSLGARVILYSLQSLKDTQTDWEKEDFTIRSVHLFAAAVDNEEVSTDPTKGFGSYIESEVDTYIVDDKKKGFHSFFSPEDDTLSLLFGVPELDQALGESGADSSISDTLPGNYDETDVELKLIGDTNGDGEFDDGIGDNHSGSNVISFVNYFFK